MEKSLAKQKLDFNKTSDNARSVFLQLAKKETNRSQKLAQVVLLLELHVFETACRTEEPLVFKIC